MTVSARAPWTWGLPLVGLLVGVVFGTLSMGARYAGEPIDASGLAWYGGVLGAFFGLMVGATGSIGAYLAAKIRPTSSKRADLLLPCGAALGVAFGWALLLLPSAASTATPLDSASLVVASLSAAGSFVGVWLVERRRRRLGPPGAAA